MSTIACAMENSCLKTDEWFGYSLVNGHFHNISLISRESRECAKVRRSIEEISIKRSHTQTCPLTNQIKKIQPDVARIRITASSAISIPRNFENSLANLIASSARLAFHPG